MMRRLAIGLVAVTVLTQAAALCHAASAQQPRQLVTRPVRAGGVGAIQLADRQRVRRVIAGAVVSVQPWRRHEIPDWWIVELAGAGAPEARTFVAMADSRAGLPLRVGEAIRATIDCTRGGWHYVCDGAVATAAGELLFASSGSGEDGAAPGWRLVGHSANGVANGDRLQHTLELEHAGGRTTTALSGWTSVLAPDGEWLVTGGFSEWDPQRPRLPEAVDFTTYAITRVRGSAGSGPTPLPTGRRRRRPRP